MPKQLTSVLHSTTGVVTRVLQWFTASDEVYQNSADNTKDIYIMHAGIDILVHHVTLSTIMLCVHVYFEGFSLKALYLQVTFLYCKLCYSRRQSMYISRQGTETHLKPILLCMAYHALLCL